jgi:hypothetical protein
MGWPAEGWREAFRPARSAECPPRPIRPGTAGGSNRLRPAACDLGGARKCAAISEFASNTFRASGCSRIALVYACLHAIACLHAVVVAAAGSRVDTSGIVWSCAFLGCGRAFVADALDRGGAHLRVAAGRVERGCRGDSNGVFLAFLRRRTFSRRATTPTDVPPRVPRGGSDRRQRVVRGVCRAWHPVSSLRWPLS